MKQFNIKSIAIAAVAGLTLASCEDFLDRPTEDTYTVGNYYNTDDQLYASVNTLYNSPWYDFQRGFFKVGEVLSGNYYWGASPYLTFTVNGTDEDLVNMSASLWSVNAYANTALANIDEYAGSETTEAVRNACKGEALVWKAMAYFYLVRSFGGVPIVHDNQSLISDGSYNSLYRATPKNVYDYIVMTLEKAIEWLPESADDGRLDQYSAKGLLAKVYLTMAGISGTLDDEDLQNAVDYAKDVINNSGRELMETYSDIFRLENNVSDESLIAWRWTAEGENWTRQNTLQSDLAPTGFSELGDTWGGWAGPSVDLQDAFGEDALTDLTTGSRYNVDDRRQATLMMAGDHYDYFWQDHGGFEILEFYFGDNSDWNGKGGSGTFESPTGAQEVKHLVGDQYDHQQGCGVSMVTMCTSLATHILRLADVYLILAEAQCLLDGGSTTDADAVAAYNAVRMRSTTSGYISEGSSLDWETIWKERRLELACEGDRWYDYVRVSYYNLDFVIDEINNQRRDYYYGLSDLYETYYNEGGYDGSWDTSNAAYATIAKTFTLSESSFTLPFPDTDLLMNPHMSEDPVEVDITQYSY